MVGGLNKLPLASLSLQESFDGCWRLIIRHIKSGCIAFGFQFVEHFFKRYDDCIVFEVWAPLSKSSISIIIVRHSISLDVLKRFDWECTSRVGVKGTRVVLPNAAQQNTLLAL